MNTTQRESERADMSLGAVRHGGSIATIHQILPCNSPHRLHFQQVSVAPRRRSGRWPTLLSTFRAKASAGGESAAAAAVRTSFYELLGISEGDSFEEIKRAYKQLARRYHPDVSPPDRTEEYTRRFIEVQEAYETLSDPRLRALYDRDLSSGLHFAFSTRRRRYDEELEQQSHWRSSWQNQLSELKRRSMNKDSGDNLSWGARMRRQRAESPSQ